MGRMIDISRGGLSFNYIDQDFRSEESFRETIKESVKENKENYEGDNKLLRTISQDRA